MPSHYTEKPGYSFPGTVPKQALEFFRGKDLKIPAFHHLDVFRKQHVAAFTVSKAMQGDILVDVQQSLDKSLAEGKTYRHFAAQLTPTLQAKGWWGRKEMVDPKTGETVEVELGSPRRLKTIYRTNLRTARSAGAWDRIQRTKKTHPFLIYELGPSENHRPEHVAWKGTLLPADDPWWDTHYGPNGWGCKCRARQISKAEADRLGGPTPRPPLDPVQWTNKRTGETSMVPRGIDPGWDYNPGKVRQSLTSTPPPPPVNPNAIQILDETAMDRQITPASGSNPGGMFRGRDGVTRYIKHYEDPTQAYSEAVANRIYRELGFDAPNSALVRRSNGKLSFAGELIEGRTLQRAGLTKARAEKALQGFAADVWLANWDAAGLNLDNMMVAGSKIARIDQGGSLLFRARAGRKPLERLRSLSEWEGFASGGRNPAYARIFEKAGITEADELGRKMLTRITNIKALGRRTRNFADLVPKVEGVSEDDRKAILSLLRKRAKLLQDEIAPRIRASLRAPAGQSSVEAEFIRRMGSRYNSMKRKALSKANRSGTARHGTTDAELTSIYSYTTSDGTWGYGPLNEALRSDSPTRHARFKPYKETLKAALAKLPDYRGHVRRGTTLPADVWSRYRVGEITPPDAFLSSSRGNGWSGDHRFVIESLHGKRVERFSAYESEQEVLFAADSTFRVVSIEPRSGGGFNIDMKEIEPSAQNRAKPAWKPSPADLRFIEEARQLHRENDAAVERGDLVPASLRRKVDDQVKTHAVLSDPENPATKLYHKSYDEITDQIGDQID